MWLVDMQTRITKLEDALKKIIYVANHQGAFTGLSWYDIGLLAEAALAGEETISWEKVKNP